jgi:hypothetical protein
LKFADVTADDVAHSSQIAILSQAFSPVTLCASCARLPKADLLDRPGGRRLRHASRPMMRDIGDTKPTLRGTAPRHMGIDYPNFGNEGYLHTY